MTPEQALSDLKWIATNKIYELRLRKIVLDLLADPRFLEAPGGAEHHHAYRGGLAVHTLEVVQKAYEMQPNERILVAAILHDYAKLWEYEILPGGKIVKTKFAKLIGHVAYSWFLFMKAAIDEGLPSCTINDIAHAMLAHHGRREWGSPVEPCTSIAFALHSADMLSMQAGKEAK